MKADTPDRMPHCGGDFPVFSSLLRRLPSMAAALVAALFFVPQPGCKGSRPHLTPTETLVAEAPLVDLGEIDAGRIYGHGFKIQNRGNSPVTIARIRPSCGVFAELSPPRNLIAPGQSATVLARLDARTVSGSFSRSVVLMTNGPNGGELKLTVEGIVVSPVNVAPSPIEFGLVSPKKKKAVEGIIDLRDANASLESVSVPDDHFSLKLLGDEVARTRPFELSFKGSAVPVRISTDLIVRLETEPEPLEVRVPIRAQVYGDLRYARDVYLLHDSDGNATPRDVPLTTRSGKTFRILKASDPSERTSVEIVEPRGSPAILRLRARTTPQREKIEGQVVFETNLRGEIQRTIHYIIPAFSPAY